MTASSSVGVLFLNTPVHPPLGADTWVHAQIMRGLSRTDHRLFAACVPETEAGPTPTYSVLREIDGLTIVPMHPGPELRRPESLRALLAKVVDAGRMIASVVRLALHIRRHDIRIVHTSDRPRDAVMAVLLSRVTRAHSIVHVHVLFKEWMSRPLQWSIAHADARIAVSEFVRTSLGEIGRDDTYVVLNAIEPARWRQRTGREETRRELGIPTDAPVVVTACRLFREKGPLELITAIAELREELPDIRLLVLGHDPTGSGLFYAELQALVAERDLHDTVTFLGRRDDVPRLFAAADVFAMPSFEEPFGLVFLEAMASEIPVVALDNGGTLEVVRNGVDGLLSQPGDAAALFDNLRTLLLDADLRATMGAAGCRRVEELFTIERMAADTADVYCKVIR